MAKKQEQKKSGSVAKPAQEAPKQESGMVAGATIPMNWPSGWFKATDEELQKIQAAGKLAGYNPQTKEALVAD